MQDGAKVSRHPRTSLKRTEVADRLRGAIVAGSYANGSLLPGENELAREFSVSRSTIRSALVGLAEEKLIDTRTGVGSFVTFDGISLDQTPSWGRALAMSGVHADVQILRIERLTDPDLAASVGSESMEFLALDRIRRLGDGTAISLERSRVPAVGALAAAPEQGLLNDSLSATMTAAGLVPTKGEQWISAAPLGTENAGLLGRTSTELFVNSVRIARDGDGRFVEKVVSWLDPQHFRLHVNFGS